MRRISTGVLLDDILQNMLNKSMGRPSDGTKMKMFGVQRENMADLASSLGMNIGEPRERDSLRTFHSHTQA